MSAPPVLVATGPTGFLEASTRSPSRPVTLDVLKPPTPPVQLEGLLSSAPLPIAPRSLTPPLNPGLPSPAPLPIAPRSLPPLDPLAPPPLGQPLLEVALAKP